MSEAPGPQEEDANFKSTERISPGRMLKLERDRQGVSLDEAALQLNLRPAVVRGLEADRYDEVPIPAYRRGYLRAYARYMGIEEGVVVDAYDAIYGRADLDRKVAPVHSTPPPSRIGAWIFKLFTVLVVLGLIGLTLLWWQSREGSDLLGLIPSEPVNVQPIDVEPADQGSVDTPALAAQSGSTDSDTDNSDASLPPQPEEIDQFGLISEQDEAAASAAEGAAVISNEALGMVDASETPAAPATTDRLQLTFHEQSWTEIFDASDQRVLIGLQPAGSEATVEGEPPFRLTIGNASGVELSYAGEPVELERHTGSSNVARFTLGE